MAQMKNQARRGFIEQAFEAFYSFWSTFKKTFWLILLLVIFKDVNLLFDPFISSHVIKIIFEIIQYIFIIYIGSMILYVTQDCLTSHPVNYQQAFLVVRIKILYVLGYFLLLFIISEGILYFGQHITYLLISPTRPHANIFNLLLSLFFTMIILFMYIRLYFVIPLILSDDMTLWGAMQRSFKLVLDNMLVTFNVFIILMLTLLVTSQHAHHALVLRHYHLNFVFDYMILSLLIPFTANLSLLLFMDLKAQYDEVEKYLKKKPGM